MNEGRYVLELKKKESVNLGDVARVTGGELSGNGNAFVNDVTHDSRQAGEGSLFVAVRGELFDAHRFIPQVIEQGALGVISELDPTDEWRPRTASQSLT